MYEQTLGRTVRVSLGSVGENLCEFLMCGRLSSHVVEMYALPKLNALLECVADIDVGSALLDVGTRNVDEFIQLYSRVDACVDVDTRRLQPAMQRWFDMLRCGRYRAFVDYTVTV